MPSPFNIYLQLRDGATNLPKLLNPDWITGQVTWEYQEQGGLSQIAADLAVPFETTGIAPGDYLEVWAVGETVPRARGIINTPEKVLDLKETRKLLAFGRMTDQDKVLDYKVIIHPNGSAQDVSLYAAELFADYQQRKAQSTATAPLLVADIQSIGVNLDQLVLAPGSVRQGMDAIYTQCGGNCVWGWDIHPVSGCDRFYLRPRTATVANQYFVGNNVKLLNTPSELDPVVNGILLRGGPAKYVNYLTNASYEQPQNPSSDSGDLITDGGFETPYNGTLGGDTNLSPWTAGGGVTRNAYDPATNHNGSAHTGRWYLLLDNTGKYVYRDLDISADAVGQQYIAFLYAGLENGLHTATGTFVLTQLDGGLATVGTPVTLNVGPASTTWTGGAADSVIGSDSLQTSIIKSSASAVKLRVRMNCTATTGAGYGLLIDDIVVAKAGAVGQLGWGTHLRNPGSGANVFQTIDWACRAASWDGAYGVRTTVTASAGNECYINPAGPDLDPNSQYHFTPMPQQDIVFGYRIRMKPGAGSGLARVEWREWASDGHQDSVQQTDNFTIPDDGTWYTLCGRFSTHGDVKTATTQLALAASGTYDIDGAFARDAAASDSAILIALGGWTTSGADDHIPQLCTNDASQQSPVKAGYLRGDVFERYVKAEDVCTFGTASYNSYATWGRREALVENQQIIDWTADAATYAKAYFDRQAVLLSRPKVELINETATQPTPASGQQVQISGTGADIAPQWCSKAAYTWSRSALNVSLDLNNERPTWAKLLKSIQASSSGSANVSVGAPAASSGGGGVTTPPPGLRLFQLPRTATGGTNAPITLAHAPDGNLKMVFSDLGLEDPANYTLSGTTLTPAFGDPAQVSYLAGLFSY